MKVRRRWITLSIRGEGEGGSECWAIHGWWKHSDTVGRCLRMVANDGVTTNMFSCRC